MLNRAVIMGRLVADPETRTVGNDTMVTTFRVAVDRDFKNKQTGEREADFINVVAWRQAAEFVSRYFTKGRYIVVDGRLQSRNYNDRDGNRRSTTELVAEHVHFGGDEKAGNSSAPNTVKFQEYDDDDGDLPF